METHYNAQYIRNTINKTTIYKRHDMTKRNIKQTTRTQYKTHNIQQHNIKKNTHTIHIQYKTHNI